MGLPPGTSTQFNYVSRDCERLARQFVETLGAGPFFFWELTDPALTPTRTYRGQPAGDTFKGCYGFVGSTMLEILQPTNDAPSLLREVLDVKGEGLQHIFPRIRPMLPAEFDAQHAAYVAAGCACVSDGFAPLVGRAEFFDGMASVGAFIELIEFAPPSYEMIEAMYDAHIGWRGERPFRMFDEVITAVLGGAPESAGAEAFRRIMTA